MFWQNDTKPGTIKTFCIRCVILLLVCACGTPKTNRSYQLEDTGPPKIIFLNYQLTKLANGDKSIKLSGKKITDGKLKRDNTITNLEAGDLQCKQIDKNGVVLQSKVIKNPFVKTIEYLNDANHFKTNQIHVNNTSLSLRLQLHSRTAYIVISDVPGLNETPKPLIKTKVNP